MTETFSHPSGAPVGLERTVETGVPFPPELAAAGPGDYAAPEAPEQDGEEHAYGVPDDAPPIPVELPEQPLFAGTYAAYDDGKGGALLVLQPKGGETLRKHIPAHLLKMAEKFSGGGPGGLLKMFG